MASSMSSTDADLTSQSQMTQMLFGTVSPAVIASILVLARFYSRAIIMKSWGHDDSWILFSWVIGSIAFTILNGVFMARNTARQALSPTPEELAVTMRLGFVSRELYQVCVGTTKLGLCSLYLRIFQDRWSRALNWTLMGFIATFTFALSIGIVFQCRPISGDWNDIPDKCGNQAPGIVTSGVVNILADILLLLFVISRILKLQITKRQKISLLAIVCLGLLVIVAAITRLIFTLQVLLKSKDQPWDSSKIAIWSAVEVNTGLCCASAPAVKPLLRKLAPNLLSTMPGASSPHNTDPSSRGSNTHKIMPILYKKNHEVGGLRFETLTDIERVFNESTV